MQLGLTCRTVRALAPLYAGRDLPDMLLGRIDAHAAACPACGAEIHAFEEDRARLHEFADEVESRPMGPEMGERFWLDIRRGLRVEGPVGPRPARAARRRVLVPLGLAWRAAAACLVIGLAVWFGRTPWNDRAGPAGAPGGRGVAARPEGLASGGSGPVRAMPVRDGGGWELAPRSDGMEPVRREGSARGWVEPVEPYHTPSTYPLEGWQAPPRDREVLDF